MRDKPARLPLGFLALILTTPILTRAQEPAFDWTHAAPNHATISPADNGRTAITFQPADWPGISIKADPPWNWSSSGAIAFEIRNPGPRPVTAYFRVDDHPSADGLHHCRTAHGTIDPGKTVQVAVTVGTDPMSLGMRGLPGPASEDHTIRWTLDGTDKLDMSHITAVTLFLIKPAQDETLAVAPPRFLPPMTFDRIVDAFGQYARADWPGKLHNETELQDRRKTEAADLAAHPSMPDRDRFGGWTAGPQLDKSGYFRTEKRDGVWWLVDPDGRLFFSSGIDCLNLFDATVVTGRENMFSWLPKPDEPLGRFWGSFDNVHSGPARQGRAYDFFRANLFRKYGDPFESTWRDRTLQRLPSWGFNTIGNWSNESFYRGGKSRVPYVATGGVWGNHARLSSGSDYWGLMHDPFDPAFARDVETSLAPLARDAKGDPWCVGYFVDNELSWGSFDGGDNGRYGLALGALKAPQTSHARQALIAQLVAKYTDIAQLNAAWGTTFNAWNDLESKPFEPSNPLNDAQKRDLADFVHALATRYFTTIAQSLHRLDPDHLYLGCRFAWKTTEAIQAAAKICDVVSFNIYEREVDPKKWAFLNDLDKPAIIGEFHVGALDRGMFHPGLVSAHDQNDRAAIFGRYVRSVADHPALVGCHWFQYIDEPLTGRTLDGENYNIGFLNVTDTPYPEMVDAARAVHAELYPRRFAIKR